MEKIDTEIISTYLFKCIITNLNISEHNILNNINITKTFLIENINKIISENIERFINDLLINKENKLFKADQIQKLNTNKNNKKGKGRNSELNENKKYCNHPRTRNRGLCRIIIYKYEVACKYHLPKDYDNNSIINNNFCDETIPQEPQISQNKNINHKNNKKVSFNENIEIKEIEKNNNYKYRLNIKNVSYEDIYNNICYILDESLKFNDKFKIDYNNLEQLKNCIKEIYNDDLKSKYSIFYLYNTFLNMILKDYLNGNINKIDSPYMKSIIKKCYEGIVRMFKDGDYLLICILALLDKKKIKKIFKIKRESLDNFEDDKIKTSF